MPSSIFSIRLPTRALVTSFTPWHRTRNMGKTKFVLQVALATERLGPRRHDRRREAPSWGRSSCCALDLCLSLLFSHFPPPILIFPLLLVLLSALNALLWQRIAKRNLSSDCMCCIIAMGSQHSFHNTIPVK